MPERKAIPSTTKAIPSTTYSYDYNLTYTAHTQASAAQAVSNDNQSLLVLGIAGTGKTTYLRHLVEHLRSCKKKVDIISKTHCASSRAGGVTADHYVRRYILHGTCTADYLWIDEVSQADIGILCQLNKLTYTNVKFLISGDFNQFAPLFNTYKGAQVPDDAFERSRLLHRMAGGNRLVLTECMRSDAVLFGFYSTLIAGGARFAAPLSAAVADAKRDFRYQGPARWNLVISHAKRIRVNRELNRFFAPEGAVFVEVKPKKND